MVRVWDTNLNAYRNAKTIRRYDQELQVFVDVEAMYATVDEVKRQVWPVKKYLSLLSGDWTSLYIRTDPGGKVAPTVAYLSEGIRFTGRTDDKYNTSAMSWGGIFTKKPYNLSHYHKICARIRVYDNISDKYNYTTYTQLGIATQNTEWGYYSIPTGMKACRQDTNRVTTDPVELIIEVDISGVTGIGYPYIGHSCAYSKVLVKEIWLEI